MVDMYMTFIFQMSILSCKLCRCRCKGKGKILEYRQNVASMEILIRDLKMFYAVIQCVPFGFCLLYFANFFFTVHSLYNESFLV